MNCHLPARSFTRLLFTLLFSSALLSPTLLARTASMKLATLAPKGTIYHQYLMEMKDLWQKAPKGGVKLTIYPDGQMGSEANVVRRMRVNQIQVAMMTATGLIEIDTAIAALQNMPMMFRDLEESKHVRGKLRPMINENFTKKDFKLLFLEDAGWVYFYTTKKAVTPDEFSKLKIFALSSDPKSIQIWKSAGFQPVALDTTAMLTGLKTGMIDVVPSTPIYALAGQFYRPAPFMLEIKWAPLVGGMVVTQAAWDSIDKETQDALEKAANDVGTKLLKRSRAEDDEATATMKERGMTVVTPTPADVEAWRTRVEKAHPIIRGQIVDEELFDQVKELLEDFRKGKE